MTMFKGKHGLDGNYGIDGEFFCKDDGQSGQSKDKSILDYNSPSKTQPGLWCKWAPTEDGEGIEWDGNEKFYDYVEWLKYINNNFLKPWGIVLTGSVTWQGEEHGDIGTIHAINGEISTSDGAHVVYENMTVAPLMLDAPIVEPELDYGIIHNDILEMLREGITVDVIGLGQPDEHYVTRGKTSTAMAIVNYIQKLKQ